MSRPPPKVRLGKTRIPAIEGSVGRYEFLPDQSNGFTGVFSVVVLDVDPADRIRKNKSLTVVPLASSGKSGIRVRVGTKPRYAIVEAATTINPNRLELTHNALSLPHLQAVRTGLAACLQGVRVRTKVVTIPTTSSPSGRMYAVIGRNRSAKRALAIPVDFYDGYDPENPRLRSFTVAQLRKPSTRCRLNEDAIGILQRVVSKNLGLPSPRSEASGAKGTAPA